MGKISAALGKLKPVAPAAVTLASAFAFGYGQNRYRDGFSVKGFPADGVAGAALVGASLAAKKWGGGTLKNKVAPVAMWVGLGGLISFVHTLGAGKGATDSGMARLMVSKDDLKKIQALLPGKVTVLGAIAPAPKGDLLSTAQLLEMARG